MRALQLKIQLTPKRQEMEEATLTNYVSIRRLAELEAVVRRLVERSCRPEIAKSK